MEFGALIGTPKGGFALETLSLSGKPDGGMYQLSISTPSGGVAPSLTPALPTEWWRTTGETHSVSTSDFTFNWGWTDTWHGYNNDDYSRVDHDVLNFTNFYTDNGFSNWSHQETDSWWSDSWGAGESHNDTVTTVYGNDDVIYTDVFFQSQQHVTYYEDGFWGKG